MIRSAQLSRHLFLTKELVRRDFQARYAGSALGLLWSFAPPLWQLLLFSFVFGWVIKVPLRGEATDSFAVFVFCGLLPWGAFQEGVSRGMTSLVESSAIVKKMRVSLRAVVIAPLISSLLHEIIALVVFAFILLVQGRLGGWSLLLLAPALLAQLLLTAGIAQLLGALYPVIRDLGQVIPMLLTGWMYFTPIVYPIAAIPEKGRWVLELNPMTTIVSAYRDALLGSGDGFPVELGWVLLASAVIFAFGAEVFRRWRGEVVDLV